MCRYLSVLNTQDQKEFSLTLLFTNKTNVFVLKGAWAGVVVRALRYYSDGLGIDSRCCHSLRIFSVATDRTMCPGVDSASKNEYQGFLLRVKAAGA